MRYFFSGNLTQSMMDMLSKTPGYEPIDVLVSQLDRASINKMMEFQDEGKVNKLFIDSGAYSVHTGKATIDIEEYIEYLNRIDDRIALCAQVDTIPGSFGKPKSKEDYQLSAQKSWENYLYMRTKLRSPDKLIPIYHYGESLDALYNMLNYVDENGKPLSIIGLSPANDTHQNLKNIYLKEMYDIIHESKNPGVRTHLFGMTSIDALRQFPCYSADSISHRLQAAYGKILHPKFGVVSVSKRTRSTKVKSNMSFLEVADPDSLKELEEYINNLGLTMDQIADDPSARVVVCMYGIMQIVKDINKNGLTKPRRSKRLF